jgi:hypothetical protein
VSTKRPLSSRSVEKRSERERNTGLDPEDEASRWLEEHDPKPPPPVPKRASKNKTLHRWRKRAGQ